MPARYKEVVRSIVKKNLGSGIISDFDEFQKDLFADAEDIIEIIDKVEKKFSVEFTDSEHFKAKSIDDICKILSQKNIDNSMIMSFGGVVDN